MKDRDKLYDLWQTMKMSCYWDKHRNYKHIGAKGIKVCDDWKNSFKNFEQFAVKNGYHKDLTVNRKDLNKDFEPNNVIFVSRRKRAGHKISTKYLTYNGKTQNLTDWARERNIKKQTLSIRLKRGWTIGQALEFEERYKKILIRKCWEDDTKS